MDYSDEIIIVRKGNSIHYENFINYLVKVASSKVREMMTNAFPQIQSKISNEQFYDVIAESFLTYCKNEIFGNPEHERLMNSCNGSFSGFNGDNPARICAMAALYGLDNLDGVCFRTPRAWKAAGYELKDTARPFFVVTPKFCEVVEKEDNAEELTEEDPAEKLTIKGAKDEYNLFPVYGSFDVQKVREKAVRKTRTAEKQAAEDSALDAARMEARAIMSHPAAAASYSSGRLAFALVTAPAKKAAPAPDSLRQLALSL